MTTLGQRVLVTVAALGCLAVAVPARPAAEGPREVVSETVAQVVAVLHQQNVPAEARRKQIEAIVDARFQFDTLARLVMARNWSKLSPDQQTRFVEEFRRHLSVTYGRNIDSYHNETVEVLGDREEARGDWSVKTKIARGGGGDDILVDYRLRKAGDVWKVIDVTIEGVSLVANFRAQFQELMANDGAEKMLTLLAQKNAAGETILPPGKPSAPAGGAEP